MKGARFQRADRGCRVDILIMPDHVCGIGQREDPNSVEIFLAGGNSCVVEGTLKEVYEKLDAANRCELAFSPNSVAVSAANRLEAHDE